MFGDNQEYKIQTSVYTIFRSKKGMRWPSFINCTHVTRKYGHKSGHFYHMHTLLIYTSNKHKSYPSLLSANAVHFHASRIIDQLQATRLMNHILNSGFISKRYCFDIQHIIPTTNT